MKESITIYKWLIDEKLPATYQYPVRFNHCFARIVLDWLFQDCWYNHLSRRQAAVGQLSEKQLQQAIDRMQLWLQDLRVLIMDNAESLRYRRKNG